MCHVPTKDPPKRGLRSNLPEKTLSRLPELHPIPESGLSCLQARLFKRQDGKPFEQATYKRVELPFARRKEA